MALAQTAASSNALALGPLAPFLMDQYGVDRAGVGFSVSALYTGTSLLSLLAGWLNDRFGVRRTLALGQLVLGVALVSLTQARAFGVFLGGLVLAGFGYSVVAPATTKALMDWFPPHERGMAVAVKQTGFTIGGMLAAALVPTIALVAGWQAAVLAFGALPIALGLVGFVTYRDRHVPSLKAVTAAIERRDVRQVLADPALVLLAGAAILFGMQQAALTSYSVLFFRDAVGLEVVVAGAMLALMQASGTLARLAFGWLSDRKFLHRRIALLVICAIVGIAGSLALAVLSPGVPAWALAATAVVAGIGGLGWVGLLMVVVAELAGPGRAALGVGMSTTFTFVGFVVGPPIFGAVAGGAGFEAAWLGEAAILALALVPLAMASRRSRRTEGA